MKAFRLFVLSVFAVFVATHVSLAAEACPDPNHVQIDEFIAANLPPKGAQYVVGTLTVERAPRFIERFNETFYEEKPVTAEGVRIISARGYPNSLVIFTEGQCATLAMFFKNELVGYWLNGEPDEAA